MLGDATGGKAQNLLQMSLAFGQMASTGRLMGQDLLQMINAGFNPLKEISRTTGEDVIELKKKMEKGGISLEMVKNAFRTATSAGGSFNQGMEKASKTLSGLFSTMLDDVDAAKRAFGKEIIEGLNLKGIVQLVSLAAQKFGEWFKGLDKGTKGALLAVPVILVGAATAMLGLVVAAKLASLAFGVLMGVMNFLQITTLLNVVSWVAWTAASFAASAATLVIKAAVWLLNAALTATNVLLGLVYAAALLFIGLGVAAVFVLIAGAVWGVVQAGTALFDALSIIPTTSGPVAEILGLFKEWWTALKNVAAVAQKDLPMAWELLQLELAIAVGQITDLWPPLWAFIQEGFDAVWELVVFRFKTGFREGVAEVLNVMSEFLSVLPMHKAFREQFGLNAEAMEQFRAKIEEANNEAGAVAKDRLSNALAGFKVEEGPATKAAKQAAQDWYNQFGEELLGEEEESIWTRLVEGIGPEMAKGGAALEDTQKKAKALKDEFKNVDAVAFGSAEALSRIAAFSAGLEKRPTPGSYAANQDRKIEVAQGAGPGEGVGGRITEMLKEIRDGIQKGNEKPNVEVDEAALA